MAGKAAKTKTGPRVTYRVTLDVEGDRPRVDERSTKSEAIGLAKLNVRIPLAVKAVRVERVTVETIEVLTPKRRSA